MAQIDADTRPHEPIREPQAFPAGPVLLLRRPLDYWFLWIIALASFGFNLYLVRQYLDLRAKAAHEIVSVVGMVGEFRRASFDYVVNIDEQLPVSATVPVNFDVLVPVERSIPIDTNVTIPIETFLGTYRFNAPIFTTIDIDFDIDVPINETIDFETTVPVKFDVPITIAFEETPLGPILDDVYKQLIELATSLGATGLPE